jgi:hypothetical protein
MSILRRRRRRRQRLPGAAERAAGCPGSGRLAPRPCRLPRRAPAAGRQWPPTALLLARLLTRLLARQAPLLLAAGLY